MRSIDAFTISGNPAIKPLVAFNSRRLFRAKPSNLASNNTLFFLQNLIRASRRESLPPTQPYHCNNDSIIHEYLLQQTVLQYLQPARFTNPIARSFPASFHLKPLLPK